MVRQEVIILNLYSDNFFDIEEILKKVESLQGVKQVEVFHSIRIRYSQIWLMREINKRLGADLVKASDERQTQTPKVMS